MLELHTGEPMLWKQEKKAACTSNPCMRVYLRYLCQKVQTEREDGVQRAQFITTSAQVCVSMFSGAIHVFSPDLFYLWWSGTVNCCWTQIEVSPCLSPPPLLSPSLAPQTRGRAGKKAWR